MRYVLENETLRVEIDSYGAEIKSIQRKSDGMEYMWQADPKYWGRTSPVLFPFVGVPKNKEYSYEGKTYSMGQHGFARDMEFTCESALTEENETDCVHIKDANNVWFALDSNDETYEKYPFRFRLHIGYELTGNQVKVSWRVKNIDGKPMYFSIGAHPAFRCPIHGEVDKYEYGLHFAGRTSHIHHHGNTPDGLAVMDELGASKIELERSSDGVNWSPVKTFYSSNYPQLLDPDDTSFTYSGYVTHTYSSGYYYCATVTLYAKQGNGTASATVTTDILDLT